MLFQDFREEITVKGGSQSEDFMDEVDSDLDVWDVLDGIARTGEKVFLEGNMVWPTLENKE